MCISCLNFFDKLRKFGGFDFAIEKSNVFNTTELSKFADRQREVANIVLDFASTTL